MVSPISGDRERGRRLLNLELDAEAAPRLARPFCRGTPRIANALSAWSARCGQRCAAQPRIGPALGGRSAQGLHSGRRTGAFDARRPAPAELAWLTGYWRRARGLAPLAAGLGEIRITLETVWNPICCNWAFCCAPPVVGWPRRGAPAFFGWPEACLDGPGCCLAAHHPAGLSPAVRSGPERSARAASATHCALGIGCWQQAPNDASPGANPGNVNSWRLAAANRSAASHQAAPAQPEMLRAPARRGHRPRGCAAESPVATNRVHHRFQVSDPARPAASGVEAHRPAAHSP